MRLGILSDTHDELARVRRAVKILQAEEADILIHCGDITSPAIVQACAVLPAYFTFGNHDADSVPTLREAITSTGGTCLNWGDVVNFNEKWVAIVHGHMTTDIRRVMVVQPDYLLSGHTHMPHDHRGPETRRINPGALYRADSYTVALLDLATDDLKFITIDESES